MARMPDIFHEAEEAASAAKAEVRDDLAHLFHHDRPQPVFIPNIQPVPTEPPSQESHMSFPSELHRIEQVVESLGEDGIAVLEAVAGHPETQAAVIMLARLAGIPLTPGTINAGMAGLAAIENVWHTAQAALSQPQQQAPANGAGAHAAQPGTPQVI